MRAFRGRWIAGLLVVWTFVADVAPVQAVRGRAVRPACSCCASRALCHCDHGSDRVGPEAAAESGARCSIGRCAEDEQPGTNPVREPLAVGPAAALCGPDAAIERGPDHPILPTGGPAARPPTEPPQRVPSR